MNIGGHRRITSNRLYLTGAVLLVQFVLVGLHHVDEEGDRFLLDDWHALEVIL